MVTKRSEAQREKEMEERLDKAAQVAVGLLMSGDSMEVGDLQDLIARFLGRVVSKVLEGEMRAHIGYSKGGTPPVGQANRRNGTTTKTVRSAFGPVEIQVPRDRKGEFEPRIVPKYKRDILGFDEKILNLYSKGMSVRDIKQALAEMYNIDVSTQFISSVTDAVIEEFKAWRNRPLESLYYIVYVDGIYAKTRETGSVTKRVVYTAIGVAEDGHKDVLGFYVQPSESAKFWMAVFKDLKERGVQRIGVLAADGLTGMQNAVTAVFPQTVFQTCVVHLIRSSTKFVSYKSRKALTGDLKKVYTAPNEVEAKEALRKFKNEWDDKYPMVSAAWENRWDEWTPFLDLPQEARRIIYTTNAIEGLHRRLRKVIKTRGAFPSDDSLLKVLFLAIKEAKRSWGSPSPHWSQARLQLAIHFNLMEEV